MKKYSLIFSLLIIIVIIFIIISKSDDNASIVKNVNTDQQLIVKQQIHKLINSKLKPLAKDQETLNLLLDHSQDIKKIIHEIDFKSLQNINTRIKICLLESSCYLDDFDETKDQYFDRNDTPFQKTMRRILQVSSMLDTPKIESLFEESELIQLMTFDNPKLQRDVLNVVMKSPKLEWMAPDLIKSDVGGEGLAIFMNLLYQQQKKIFNQNYQIFLNKLQNSNAFTVEEVFLSISNFELNAQQIENTIHEGCEILKTRNGFNQKLIYHVLNKISKTLKHKDLSKCL